MAAEASSPGSKKGAGQKAASKSASPASARATPPKRRKVSTACIYCRRSHMTCDDERPCRRCVRRDIGHLCHDEATVKGSTHAHSKEEGEARRKALQRAREAASAASAAAATAASRTGAQSSPQPGRGTPLQGSSSQPPALAGLAATSMAAPINGAAAAAPAMGPPSVEVVGPSTAANGAGPYSTSSLAGLAAVATAANAVGGGAGGAGGLAGPGPLFGGFGSGDAASGAAHPAFRQGASPTGTLTGSLAAAGNLSLASASSMLNPRPDAPAGVTERPAMPAGATSGTGAATSAEAAAGSRAPSAAGATTAAAPAPPSASDNSGWGWGWGNANVLGGAGFLGLGGGNATGSLDEGAITGDSAGGNEYNILSEFLESLDSSAFLDPATGPQGASAPSPAPSTSQPRKLSSAPGPGESGRHSSQPPPDSDRQDWQATLDSLAQDDIAASTSGGAQQQHNFGAEATGSSLQPALKRKRSRGTSLSGLNPFAAFTTGIHVSGGEGSAAPVATTATDAPTPSAASATFAPPSTAPPTAAPKSAYMAPTIKGLSTKERFLLTAADQNDGTRDERLAKVIKAKYDAGLLRPYNHVNGYTRLHRWMEQNVSTASRRRILHQLSIFRPAFRAVAASLRDIDLIYIEEAFERLLLDYDRVFSCQGIPACLWRRTGEICKGNKEFAELIGVEPNELKDGKLAIYELMDENSSVSFWEKYSSVCMDPSQKAVLTSCVLLAGKRPGPGASSSSASLHPALARATNGGGADRSGNASASSTGFSTPAGTKTPVPGGASETDNATSVTQHGREAPAASSTSDHPVEGRPQTSTKAEPDDAAAPEGAVQRDERSHSGSVSNPSAAATAAKKARPAEQLATSQVMPIKCCFSFTIRRDNHGLPILIAGNFLRIDGN